MMFDDDDIAEVVGSARKLVPDDVNSQLSLLAAALIVACADHGVNKKDAIKVFSSFFGKNYRNFVRHKRIANQPNA